MITGSAFARLPQLDDQLLRADFGAEHNHGASNTAASLGNGRLTVGISPWAELVYFRWPNPSRYEQLRYVTKAFPLDRRWNYDSRMSDDAQGIDWQRYGRPYELYPGMGARGGIYFQDETLSWLGDPSWISSRGYEPESGPILCTILNRGTSQNPGRVRICQWVDWDDDLLIQDFQIESASAQKFFYYATFAPYNRDQKWQGASDPEDAGFATVYLPDLDIILYFHPNHKDRAKILAHAQEKFSPALIERLYPEGGYFVAMALAGKPDGFQVGADFRGWRLKNTDPLAASEDARDGRLSGSIFYLGQSDSGLEKAISRGDNRVVVLVSAGKSAQEAVALIEKARATGLEALRQKAISDWNQISNRIELSPLAGALEKRVASRAILNLFIGRDRETGAIIASPTRQPAYHFDWPRDGAFFDLSLDLAGFPEIVSSHLDFYRRTQRRELLDFNFSWLLGAKSPFYSPKGHWHANIFTDGSPGRIKACPIEIDETSLLLWDLWRHEKFIPESERADYQKKYLEMLTLAADALVEYVDVKNGWTKKVMEDDNQKPRATLHGASSVLTGLASALDAGKRWGVDEKKLEKWRQSALALRKGILRRIEDENTLEKSGWRGIQWSLFPAPVFEDFNDPRAQKLIKRLAKNVEESAFKKRAGFAYLGEQVFILRIATAKIPEYQPLIEQAVKVLTEEAPMPGTDCFGEVTLWIDVPGYPDKVAQQRTSIPHLWTGVTIYLSVEALYQPEKFLNQIPPVPE